MSAPHGPGRARAWREALRLAPHPEGGWFRETFRASERLSGPGLEARYGAGRALVTAILYLLEAGEYSCFHRLPADELWHLHDGGPLTIHLLEPAGARALRLSREPGEGDGPQALVPHGTWFAAEPAPGVDFALAGCTVAPGFEYGDLEFADAATLVAAHPEARALIERLTPRRSPT